MTRPGRSKPENTIAIWLTLEQRAKATVIANEEGQTLSAWIKSLVLRSIKAEQGKPLSRSSSVPR